MDTWIQVSGVYQTLTRLCVPPKRFTSPHSSASYSFGEHRVVSSLSFKTYIFSKTKNPHNKENTLQKHCNNFVKQTMPLKAEDWPERRLLLSLKRNPSTMGKNKPLASVSRQLRALYKLGIDPEPCLYRVPAFLLGHCSFLSLDWVRNRSFPLQSWVKSTQRKTGL